MTEYIIDMDTGIKRLKWSHLKKNYVSETCIFFILAITKNKESYGIDRPLWFLRVTLPIENCLRASMWVKFDRRRRPFKLLSKLAAYMCLILLSFHRVAIFLKIWCFTRNHSWVRSSFFREITKAAVVRNCALCFCIRSRVTDFFSKWWSPRVNFAYFMTIFRTIGYSFELSWSIFLCDENYIF